MLWAENRNFNGVLVAFETGDDHLLDKHVGGNERTIPSLFDSRMPTIMEAGGLYCYRYRALLKINKVLMHSA